ncbi:hypothetical protein F441_00307, partial [Phytophthora nicotianae CJ01A1]
LATEPILWRGSDLIEEPELTKAIKYLVELHARSSRSRSRLALAARAGARAGPSAYSCAHRLAHEPSHIPNSPPALAQASQVVGLLMEGSPLYLPDTLQHVNTPDIDQFLHKHNGVKGIEGNELKYGDELQFGAVHTRKSARLPMRG